MSAGKLRQILSPDARIDLRDLLTHSEQRWGKAQRRAYKQRPYRAFDNLARFPTSVVPALNTDQVRVATA